MKCHSADTLKNHRIRIEGPMDREIPVGHFISVKDITTGEMIENVSTIQLTILPTKLIEAHIWLTHIGELKDETDGGLKASVKTSHLKTQNVEVDFTAIIKEAQ